MYVCNYLWNDVLAELIDEEWCGGKVTGEVEERGLGDDLLVLVTVEVSLARLLDVCGRQLSIMQKIKIL